MVRRKAPEPKPRVPTARQLEGTKKVTGGNSKCDQAWIEEMLAAGELHAPGPKPPEFMYDPVFQWDGLNEELNPDFFEFYRPTRGRSKDPSRVCNGDAYVRDERGGYIVDADYQRLRRPCLGAPAQGTNVCHAHGSQIPVVKAAAQRRIAEAAEIVALRLIGLTGVRDELDAIIEHKNRISAANSVLDRAGIKGTDQLQVTVPGFQRVLDAMFTDDKPEVPDGEG